jgi:hypothetical protein
LTNLNSYDIINLEREERKMTETTKIRIELLKQMNKYIINMGDEEIWMEWITLGVPDEPSEDDYEFIAENNDEWLDTVMLFGRLTKADIEEG